MLEHFFPQGVAGLPVLHRAPEGFAALKPSTQTLLRQHAFRPRPELLTQIGVRLTPYLPTSHGADVLLYVWQAAVQAREQYKVFGPTGGSPTNFVHAAMQSELVALHFPDTDWTHGDGLVALACFDDTVEGGRARVHHYTLPIYRHPRHTTIWGRRVIDYAFLERGFQLLYGLTPVPLKVAVRFARRLGFQVTGIWPNAIWHDGAIVDAVHTQLTREAWEA